MHLAATRRMTGIRRHDDQSSSSSSSFRAVGGTSSRRAFEHDGQRLLLQPASCARELVLSKHGRACRLVARGTGVTSALQSLWRRPSPLHSAARRGDAAKVRELLEKGASVDERDRNESTPLMHAAEKKRVAVVELLLERGASVDAANRWGFTPILYGAKGGDTLGARRVLRMLRDASDPESQAAPGPSWMRVGGADGSVSGGSMDGGFEDGRGSSDLSWEEVEAWVRTKASDARETWSVMLESSDEVEVGGQVIAGRTAEMMGVIDGQRYRLDRLFYRPSGELLPGEPRVDVRSASEAPPTPSDLRSDSPPVTSSSAAGGSSSSSIGGPEGEVAWELWAELSSNTWMPWGSTEVGVERFRLRSVGAELKGSLAVALSVSAFWLLVLPAVVSFRFAYVPSQSMAPTLSRGDLLLAERNPQELSHGDIVLFKPPPLLVQYAEMNGDHLSSRDKFVKRVIGLPGDTVSTTPDGQVVLDGAPQPGLSPRGSCESCKPPEYEIEPLRVPDGQLLVLGDNRGASADSHVWGFLPREQVEGRIFWRLLPPERFAPLGREIAAPQDE